jgi:AhpD family alkylhydroperoxidase
MDHDETTGARTARQVQDELRVPARALRQDIPDVMRGFAELSSAAMKDGALSARAKELMALAISVSKQCDGCIAAHARGAARTGASESEVAEAIGVAILMNGGPATVYGPRALMAFREFSETPPASS